MSIETFAEAELPEPLQYQLQALVQQSWPSAESGFATHDPALQPMTMLLIEEGIVLSALTILSKDIEHLGNSYKASGLSTVVTAKTQRKQGHGHILVSAALAALAASDRDLAIFTCDRPLGAFYQRAGWSLLKDTVLIGGTPQEPLPSDQFDKVTLGSFFSAKAIAAATTFIGRRIELYPGLRDRLW